MVAVPASGADVVTDTSAVMDPWLPLATGGGEAGSFVGVVTVTLPLVACVVGALVSRYPKEHEKKCKHQL